MKKIILNTYKIIPFKKELCFFLKKTCTFKKYIYRNLYFEGAFKVDVTNSKSFMLYNYEYVYIEKCIFWTGIYGEWEKLSLKIWSELAKDATYIFDVGANTGVYSLLAKCINPESKVFAFEPLDKVNSKLRKNIKLNNYDIFVSNEAISNKNEATIFYDIDEVNGIVKIDFLIASDSYNVLICTPEVSKKLNQLLIENNKRI